MDLNEKNKCEKVLSVFQKYLNGHPVPEVLWSEKKCCYYYIRHYKNDFDDFYKVDTAKDLCELLLEEIDSDVYLEFKLHQRVGDDGKMTPEGKEIALGRMQPFLVQLPEYAYLAKELYAE